MGRVHSTETAVCTRLSHISFSTVGLVVPMRDNENTTRRTVLLGVGAGGLATVLTACGGSGAESTATQESQAPEATETAPATGALASTADIPVGGGAVFADQKVVVVQPTEGEFKAYSALCTHQGCPVDSVADGSIACPCHGSKFSVADGSVQGGPATTPLGEVAIKVEGDEITLA